MGLKRSRQDSVSSSGGSPTLRSREQSVDVKIVHLDKDSAASGEVMMKCSLPPHQPLTFSSFEDYDVHYQKTHVNRCSECHRNFPDEHFLHLHIAENHDPISAAKRDQGEKTYACLLLTCDRLCSTPLKRRLHCIDKHHFPRTYDFHIITTGIDRRNSMLRSAPHRRRSSTVTSTASANESGLETGRRGSRTGRGGLGGPAGFGVDGVEGKDGEEEVREMEKVGENEVDEGREERRRVPLKLRGRGGFTHRGLGRGRRIAGETSTLTVPSQPSDSATSDPMDGLTTGMSALRFVPHSIYARGRGRERSGSTQA